MSGKEIEEIPVVCEFPDVFPEELTELPSDRDVEFVIKLMLGRDPLQRVRIGCHPMSWTS
jgi:hypothetical protein